MFGESISSTSSGLVREDALLNGLIHVTLISLRLNYSQP